MTEAEREYAKRCAERNPHAFYIWSRWLKVRRQVLRMDRYECRLCREKYHRYRKADTVHHVNHFRNRPDIALEIWYDDPAAHERRRNLISLCHDCHEEMHGYRMGEGREPATQERWD